jgi:hypothetical protein
MTQVNSHTGRSALSIAARVMIAATLTLAVLSGIVPPGLTSSGHLCKMACCAGMPPHAAGTCAHGSCHINLSTRKSPQKREEHCGAHNQQAAPHDAAHMHGAATPPVENASQTDRRHSHTVNSSAQDSPLQNKSQRPARLTVSVLTKPCPPDCGAATFSNPTQSRPRHTAAISDADRPRPPSSLRLPHTPYNLARVLDALCRRSRPRGPPPFLS